MFRPKIIYTREQLEEAVRTSKNYNQILKKLGFEIGGGQKYSAIQRRIEEYGIDGSHLQIRKTSIPRKYTEDQLRTEVGKCCNIKQLIKRLNISSGMHRKVLADIAKYGISIAHFDGREHCSGKEVGFQPTLEQIFSGVAIASRSTIKNRLIREGVKPEKCQICDRTHYLGLKIELELDHIDGNGNNNRLENLRLVCPNCHSQLPTFAGRNQQLKFSHEKIEKAVKESKSLRQTLFILGGNRADKKCYYQKVWEEIVKLKISTAHWNKQWKPHDQKQVQRKLKLEDILICGSKITSSRLKQKLFEEHLLEKKCSVCGIRHWEEKPLSFVLDHINGVNNDNRLENLRILCFICNSRTPTFTGKNCKKRPTRSSAYRLRRAFSHQIR